MNKKENKLFLVFQKYFKTLLPGRTLVLHEIDTNIERDIGYTSYTGRVCNMSLALKHPIMEGLSAKERTLLITGVFAHETLHQIFTDFHYTNITLAKYNRQEAQIIMAFANLLEDAGIEFWAPTVLGDDLLSALDYSIKVFYEKSRPISKGKSAFAQLNAALIQFGDLGIVKGEFTYPEAKTYFDKIAPLFNDGIKEPISSKRIDYAVTFMEMTRPLWEREAKEQEKFQKALNEMLRQMLVNLAMVIVRQKRTATERMPAKTVVILVMKVAVTLMIALAAAVVVMQIAEIVIQTAIQMAIQITMQTATPLKLLNLLLKTEKIKLMQEIMQLQISKKEILSHQIILLKLQQSWKAVFL